MIDPTAVASKLEHIPKDKFAEFAAVPQAREPDVEVGRLSLI
jgi:hypothetical protein